MKIFTLFLACLILSSGIAFAENLSDETSSNSKETNAANTSAYKSSPRLSYHSNKPEKEETPLGKLRPMLNQVMGNDQNGSTGGAAMPGNAKYSF